MPRRRFTLLALVLASPALLAAPAVAQDFYIEGCSLGCTSGAGGTLVGCTIFNIHEDFDLRITFSQPVDLASVTPSSLRLTDLHTGSAPTGAFSTAPGDPRTLVFRPSLTFDAQGNPVYGFEPSATYQIFLAGTAQADVGPFVRSVSGQPNLSRFFCNVFANLGVQGPVRETCPPEPNSVGSGAVLGGLGSTSLAAADLVLEANGAPPVTQGLFFVGVREVRAPLDAGLRCVGRPVARLAPPVTTDGTGRVTRPVELGSLPTSVGGGAAAGQRLYFQFWYRDGLSTNLSGGLEVTAFP